MGLLLFVFAKLRKLNVRILEGRAGEQKFSPQLIIHRTMIARIQTADIDKQLPREIILRVGQSVPLTAKRFGSVPSLPKNELYPGGQIGVLPQNSRRYKFLRKWFFRRGHVEKLVTLRRLDEADHRC